jgi:hypothetical protein
MLFSSTWQVVVERRQRARRAGRAAQILVVVAGLGFVGNAVTPWDTAYVAHNVFFGVAFGPLLAYVLCLTVLQLRNDWPRELIAINAIYQVALATYLVIVLVGPGIDTRSGLEFQAAAQKVIVYVSALALALQALWIYRVATTRPEAHRRR